MWVYIGVSTEHYLIGCSQNRLSRSPDLAPTCYGHCDFDGKFATCLRQCFVAAYVLEHNGVGRVQFINPPLTHLISHSIPLHKLVDIHILTLRWRCVVYLRHFPSTRMELSAEAIIGLVALFVTCPPSALLIYSWVRRRQRSTQEGGLFFSHPVTDARSLYWYSYR